MTELIDLSQHNGKVHWEKVKQSGIGGAILRIGIRGYSAAGTIAMDSRWPENLAGALEYGVPVGAYFFSQAVTVREGEVEAEWCAARLAGASLALPVFLDSELGHGGSGRADRLTVAQRTAAVNGFLDRSRALGLCAGVYASDSWFRSYLPPAGLHTKLLWVARYGSRPKHVSTWTGWQYTDSGTLSGVNGKVDRSQFTETIFAKQEDEDVEKVRVKIGSQDIDGFLLDGKTYVPLRSAVDALKAQLQVTWSAEEGAGVKLG